MFAAHHGTDHSCTRPQEEEDLIMKLTAWQLPPSGDVSCYDSHDTARGTLAAELIFSECPVPSHESKKVPPMPVNRCSPFASLFKSSDHDGNDEMESTRRPFLSLKLPEWIHEKAEEDEDTGVFRRRRLLSLNDSPTNSSVCSPAISCASSPATSPMSSPIIPSVPAAEFKYTRGASWTELSDSDEESHITVPSETAMKAPKAWRSGISWADLAELEEQELSCKTSSPTNSTRASTPTISLANSPVLWTKLAYTPQSRWADLPDSDEECDKHGARAPSSPSASTCASSTRSSPVSSTPVICKASSQKRIRRSGVNWADLDSDEEKGALDGTECYRFNGLATSA